MRSRRFQLLIFFKRCLCFLLKLVFLQEVVVLTSERVGEPTRAWVKAETQSIKLFRRLRLRIIWQENWPGPESVIFGACGFTDLHQHMTQANANAANARLQMEPTTKCVPETQQTQCLPNKIKVRAPSQGEC